MPLCKGQILITLCLTFINQTFLSVCLCAGKLDQSTIGHNKATISSTKAIWNCFDFNRKQNNSIYCFALYWNQNNFLLSTLSFLLPRIAVYKLTMAYHLLLCHLIDWFSHEWISNELVLLWCKTLFFYWHKSMMSSIFSSTTSKYLCDQSSRIPDM